MTCAPRQLGIAGNSAATVEPVHVRHVRVEQHELERPAGSRGRA